MTIDGAQATQPEETGIVRRRALTLDVAHYQALLDDSSMSDDDKARMIEALWSIIVGFVDLGFTVQPSEESCGQVPMLARTGPASGEKLLNSRDNPIKNPLEGAGGDAAHPKEEAS